MYIHLHWHSHYSLLEAIWSPKKIAREAADYDMKAIALTDYNGLFGAIEFYKACQEKEIAPIIWVELGFVSDQSIKDKSEDSGNIVLLAKNYAWYQQLLKIVSAANLHGRNNDKARIDLSILDTHAKDLYLLIWGNQSILGKMILNNEDEQKLEAMLWSLKNTLGKENIIIELTVQDESENPDIKKINKVLEKIASQEELTITCANNYHYAEQEDQKVSEVALAIKDGKRMFDDDRRKVTLQQHIMSEEEIRTIAINNGRDAWLIDQMISNTAMIADSINIEIPLGKILFPNYESPDFIKELYEENKADLVQA